MRKKIINYFMEVQSELKGVSKGAIATVSVVEFFICLLLSILVCVFIIHASLAQAMLSQAIEVKDNAIEQTQYYQEEAALYQKLYADTSAQFEAYKTKSSAK